MTKKTANDVKFIATCLKELLSYRDSEYSELCEFNNFTKKDSDDWVARTEKIRKCLECCKNI